MIKVIGIQEIQEALSNCDTADIYQYLADKYEMSRVEAKMQSYRVIYGGGKYGLTDKEAVDAVVKFHKVFPVISQWAELAINSRRWKVRINREKNTVEMEPRDANFILPGYVKSFQFYNKNKLPTEITVPMFKSVPYRDPGTNKIVEIPIRYIEVETEEAVDIIEDGQNIPDAELTAADEEQMIESELVGEPEEATALDVEIAEDLEMEEVEDDEPPFEDEEVEEEDTDIDTPPDDYITPEFGATEYISTPIKPAPVPVEEPMVEPKEQQLSRAQAALRAAEEAEAKKNK